jgi:Staphylococcus phage HNH endonuclease
MMMARCYNQNNPRFEHYGGRGITVCEQWHDLYAFADWIEQNLGSCPEGHSLDRINNDGDYEPGNVRWATTDMQNQNRRYPARRRPSLPRSYWPVDTDSHRLASPT